MAIRPGLLLACGLAVSGLWLLTGCMSVTERNEILDEVAERRYSAQQLRQITHNYTNTALQQIATTAALILDEADDPAIREHALEWRLGATQAYLLAAAHEDPSIVAIDLNVLTRQQQDFLSSPGMTDYFGEYAPLMRRTGEEILTTMRDLVPRFTDSEEARENFRLKLDEYADKHHLDDLRYSRSSVLPWVIRLDPVNERNVADLVASIDDRISTAQVTSSLYLSKLPELITWEVELSTHRLLYSTAGLQLQTTNAEVAQLSQHLNALMTQLPGLAKTEKQGLYTKVDEVVTTLNERVNTAENFITAEREAALKELSDLIDTLNQQITKEREAILIAVRQERLETIDAVHTLSEQATRDLASGMATEFATQLPTPIATQVEGSVMRLIDRFLLRLFALGSLLILLAALAWYLVQRRLQRHAQA